MSPASPSWLREIDHTGDIGIEVTADTLPQLYERAAQGMFSVLTDLDTVRPEEPTTITVEGRDHDALMVRWLSELNYLHTVDHKLYVRFDIEVLSPAEEEIRLQATCSGEPIDPDRHTVYTEIKAITFHELDVHETNTGWAVQVIFDM